jgi:hypothetical protein
MLSETELSGRMAASGRDNPLAGLLGDRPEL